MAQGKPARNRASASATSSKSKQRTNGKQQPQVPAVTRLEEPEAYRISPQNRPFEVNAGHPCCMRHIGRL